MCIYFWALDSVLLVYVNDLMSVPYCFDRSFHLLMWCFIFIDLQMFNHLNNIECKMDLIPKKLFIYLWLCWVFVSVRGLSLVAASGGYSSSQCAGLSLSRPLLLRSTDSRRAGSVVVAQEPSCSAACGIFPDQGSYPCPLHWQADSQPLRHQGSSPPKF